ncbi:hypothetical protein LINPERPRIM_LOCUS26856 [Linum perenne]
MGFWKRLLLGITSVASWALFFYILRESRCRYPSIRAQILTIFVCSAWLLPAIYCLNSLKDQERAADLENREATRFANRVKNNAPATKDAAAASLM